MKRITALLVVLVAILALTIPALGAGQNQEERKSGTDKSSKSLYIVQLIEKPVVAYEGDIAGFPATRPAPGKRINPNSPNVVKYVGHLTARQNAVLSSVGGQKLYSYFYTYNGFAADISAKQADVLRKNPGVLAVTKNELVNVDTSSTPAFLGLTEPGSLWYQLGDPALANRRIPGPGENVVIGIIDSGIWPEHPSFSDRDAQGRVAYGPLSGFSARCMAGEQFTTANCNLKLVGAQYFNAAWGGNAGIEAQRPWEYTSPRDYNGHGSHTAGTAGGNYGVPVTGPGAIFGSVSGIAPRARISAYKALWSTEAGDTASGQTADLVAAIDRAVADGVDVINYSISGSRTNFLDPVMVAYLYAADAGVFVATSAGNSGPGNFTVAHPGPWVTTVAAGTHNRAVEGAVTLGNGDTYEGASLAATEVSAPLINSDDAALPGANAEFVDLCYAAIDNGGVPVLDPAVVAGKIVVCERGVTARVNKSLAVAEAGGVGMILINRTPNSLNADFHSVPSIHLQDTALAPVEAYADTAGATATIHEATVSYDAPAPFVASFSSRGPLLASGDLLKPDVIAPGQDILAAVSPDGSNNGLLFNLYSGTSMSSPHVAGLGALLIDKHPTWTPMMIKSAMMTTAYDVLLDAAVPNPLFRTLAQGAGHIDPNVSADPGLVFNAGWRDWMAFLCGTTNGVNPTVCDGLVARGWSLDPSDYNSPSISIGALAGSQTIRRTLTNVGGSSATYSASYDGLAGFNVSFSPASFTLANGASKTVEITFTTTSATLNTYNVGNITWTDGSHDVRVPVVLYPVALGAPVEVFGTGDPISYEVGFGYNGPFTAEPRGLIAATTETRTVLDDPSDGACSLSTPNAQQHSVVVPAGTTYARFNLFDDYTDGADDLDMCVFRGTTLVGSSGSGTSAEQVSLVNPVAATYTVVVQGWATDGPDAVYTLFYWVLGTADEGNMDVSAPATAVLGDTGTIELTFNGLAPATKYLGSVAYSGTTGMPNPTIVRVDTP